MTAATGADESFDVVVTDEKRESRYEAHVGSELVGFTDYALRDERVVFTHAEVFPQWGGRGIASTLARFALDDVVGQGKVITPLCPFIVNFLRRNPSYLPHVDEKYRGRFEAGSTDR